MKPGTVVRLPDGREGTVVYRGLDGYGIRWGRIRLTDEELDAIYQGTGNVFRKEIDPALLDRIRPQAMLREPRLERLIGIPCVGEEYEVVPE